MLAETKLKDIFMYYANGEIWKKKLKMVLEIGLRIIHLK